MSPNQVHSAIYNYPLKNYFIFKIKISILLEKKKEQNNVLKFAYNMKVKLSFYVLVKKKKTQFYAIKKI